MGIAKPTVVEYHHLDAEIRRTFRELIQLLVIEIEIGSLPIVHENGAQCMLITAAQQMLADKRMESLAHAIQTILAVNVNRFRQ